MTVCRIKTGFDHFEAANVTGIKNDLGVVDGTDFDTGAGGGLRHGRGRGEEEGEERQVCINKKRRNLCTQRLAIAEKLLDWANTWALQSDGRRPAGEVQTDDWPIVT